MKKVLFLSLVLVVSFLLVGCSSNTVNNETEDNVEVEDGNTMINFKVDWEKLNSQYLENATKNTDLTEIDTIGIRIVYNQENINITQSISKEEIENNVLKKQLPISEDVSIYLVYLSREYDNYFHEERENVYYYGVLKNISFANEKNKEIDIIDDFEIYEASWEFVNEEKQKSFLEDGELHFLYDESKEYVIFPIKINYPFNESLEWSDHLVGVAGSSSSKRIENNQFFFDAYIEMPDEKGVHYISHNGVYFRPILKGENFGVDNNYINIKPLVYTTKFIFE